jgi:hypothetical protein
MANKKPKGFILQRLNSPIDGKPCVVILTLESANRKTGNMAQVWILREDINPVAAIASGDDISICGNCPHRLNPTTGKRTCYVNPGQAPLAVWRTFKAGKYGKLSDLNPEDLHGKSIRWGAYGDPAIISPALFQTINEHAKSHTGYTHQWREQFASPFKGYFMASCDGLQDYLEASAHGWKCFSVAPKGLEAPGKLCPATVTGSAAQCLSCRLCDGDKVDVWVEAHGRSAAYVK